MNDENNELGRLSPWKVGVVNNTMQIMKKVFLVLSSLAMVVVMAVFILFYISACDYMEKTGTQQPQYVICTNNVCLTEDADTDSKYLYLSSEFIEEKFKIPSFSENKNADFYLEEITDFYELIIGILFGVIAIIMGGTIIYSRKLAEEKAHDALESTLFDLKFNAQLKKHLQEQFGEIVRRVREDMEPDLDERLEFIESRLILIEEQIEDGGDIENEDETDDGSVDLESLSSEG